MWRSQKILTGSLVILIGGFVLLMPIESWAKNRHRELISAETQRYQAQLKHQTRLEFEKTQRPPAPEISIDLGATARVEKRPPLWWVTAPEVWLENHLPGSDPLEWGSELYEQRVEAGIEATISSVVEGVRTAADIAADWVRAAAAAVAKVSKAAVNEAIDAWRGAAHLLDVARTWATIATLGVGALFIASVAAGLFRRASLGKPTTSRA